jgi:sugar (pentulose or hexulose) kinase
MAHAVGVDVGTTNVKTVLLRDDGAVVAGASRPLTSRRDDGHAEQDAHALWDAVCDAIASMTASVPNAARDVVAIGVCSQYSSIVPVDAKANPVAPMVLYWDHRGTAPSFEIMAREPDAFMTFVEHHGLPPVGSGLSLGHILSFQIDQPAVHARTAAYVEPMDYVNARLTGRITATQCTMFAAQLCNNQKVGVTEYDAELVRLSGVDEAKLPPLISIDGTVGPLTPDVAARLGLPASTVVYAAMNDSHAGAYASGAFRNGHGGLAIGTTAVLFDTVDEFAVDLEHQLMSMPAPVPGRYLAWAENGISGKAVEHVLEHVVYAADELGDHVTSDNFAALDAVLSSVPAGSNGVLFLPWLAGSMAPNPHDDTRGTFLNLSLDTRRRDLVRALVEGTAHNLASLVPAVEQFSGHHIDDLAFFGGAARSRGWGQVLADVLDRPVAALVEPDRAVARAVGMVALSRHGDLGADLDSFIEVAATFEPQAATRARYDAMHQQFEAAFNALRPVYEALHAIEEE